MSVIADTVLTRITVSGPRKRRASPMKQKLTQRSVTELAKNAIPSKGNCVVWDTEIHGFGVRITAAGGVAFVLNYYVNGKEKRTERRYTLGRWPEWSADAARDEALNLRKAIK